MTEANNTKTVRAGLSRRESLLLSSLSGKGKTIFALKDVTDELKCSYKYAKTLANNLARKKWIVILRRGKYMIVPLSAGTKSEYTEHEFIIASHLATPYYIAYWSALNFHGLTEQTPFTVFVATTKRVKSREVLGTKYIFVTLTRKKFFGFSAAAVSNSRVNVSDVEKTLADAFDHPEYCGGISEAVKSLLNAKGKVSFRRLVKYGERMGNSAILKRLGFLIEVLGIEVDRRMLKSVRRKISPGFSPLDPTRKRKGRIVTGWNLLVNIPESTIEDWKRGV